MTDAPKHDDRWWTIDRPVLMAIADQIQPQQGRFPRAEWIAADLNRAPGDVADAFTRLSEGRYVTLMEGYDPTVLSLTERGYRMVGWWPDADGALDRFLTVLDERIEHATGDDRSRLVKMRDATFGVGRELGVEVLAAYIGLQLGT